MNPLVARIAQIPTATLHTVLKGSAARVVASSKAGDHDDALAAKDVCDAVLVELVTRGAIDAAIEQIRAEIDAAVPVAA